MIHEQISVEEAEMKDYTYIVIGGGIAGVTCAEHVSYELSFWFCHL